MNRTEKEQIIERLQQDLSLEGGAVILADFKGLTVANADAVRKDMVEARKAGASGTPSFVIAATNPDDPTKVTGIAFIRGAQAFPAFQSAIDSALAADEAED